MFDRELLVALLAEFVGPFALCVAGIGAIITTQGVADGGGLVAVALAHGLAIGIMVAALGHISGGQFNPAVTIAMLATGRIGLTRAVGYIVAQILGAAAGAGILTFIFPALGALGRNNPGVNLGVPGLGPDMSITAGVLMEAVMTFFLVLVIFGTAVDPRGPKAIAPLAIGLTITIDFLAGDRITGAAMNPARAIGPALVQQDFTNWWIYWVGPIVGGLIAAFAYTLFWLQTARPVEPMGRGPAAAELAQKLASQPAQSAQPVQPPKRRTSKRR